MTTVAEVKVLFEGISQFLTRQEERLGHPVATEELYEAFIRTFPKQHNEPPLANEEAAFALHARILGAWQNPQSTPNPVDYISPLPTPNITPVTYLHLMDALELQDAAIETFCSLPVQTSLDILLDLLQISIANPVLIHTYLNLTTALLDISIALKNISPILKTCLPTMDPYERYEVGRWAAIRLREEASDDVKLLLKKILGEVKAVFDAGDEFHRTDINWLIAIAANAPSSLNLQTHTNRKAALLFAIQTIFENVHLLVSQQNNWRVAKREREARKMIRMAWKGEVEFERFREWAWKVLIDKKKEIWWHDVAKKMVWYLDLFTREASSEAEILSTVLTSDEKLPLELLASVNAMISELQNTENAIPQNDLKSFCELTLKVFRKAPSKVRFAMRDTAFLLKTLKDPPHIPLFSDLTLWPSESYTRLIATCNQLANGAAASVIDTLLEISLIDPYSVLHHLVLLAAKQHGQTELIVTTLQRLGGLARLKREGEASILIFVIGDVMREIGKKEKIEGGFEKEFVEFLGACCIPRGRSVDEILTIGINEIEQVKRKDGEQGDEEIRPLIDPRELLSQVIISYLRPPIKRTSHSVTLAISLSFLRKIITPTSTTPELKSWIYRARPFSLLLKVVSILDARRTAWADVPMMIWENVVMVVGPWVNFISKYVRIVGIQEADAAEVEKLTQKVSVHIYAKSLEMDWTTQLQLRPFTLSAATRFAFTVYPVSAPAVLINMCGEIPGLFVGPGFGIIAKNYDDPRIVWIMQWIAFAEACRVDDSWIEVLVGGILRKHHSDLPFLRHTALVAAPYAFCHVLSTATSKEHERLLISGARKMIDQGVLLPSDIIPGTTEKDSWIELNEEESRIAGLVAFNIRIIIIATKILKSHQSSVLNLNEPRLVQETTKVLRSLFVSSPTLSLPFHISIFITLCSAMPHLQSEKAVDALFGLLSSIVESIVEFRMKSGKNKEMEELVTENTVLKKFIMMLKLQQRGAIAQSLGIDVK